MSAILEARLTASLTAPVAVIDLDRAIEAAIIDLRRIERGIVWGRNPPSEFTARKIEAVSSRLLGSVQAWRLGTALASPVELPCDSERGE